MQTSKEELLLAMGWIVRNTRTGASRDELYSSFSEAPINVIQYLAGTQGQNEFVSLYSRVAQEVLAERMLLGDSNNYSS